MKLRRLITSLLVAASLASVWTASPAQNGATGQRWESLSAEEQEAFVEHTAERRAENHSQREDRRSAAREYWESLAPEAQAAAKSELQEHAQVRRSRVNERRALISEELKEDPKPTRDERLERRKQRRETATEH